MTEKWKPLSGSALVVIAVGLALTTLTRDVDGFLGGMGQGAGMALLVLGAYLVGSLWREPKDVRDAWLPSRDGDA